MPDLKMTSKSFFLYYFRLKCVWLGCLTEIVCVHHHSLIKNKDTEDILYFLCPFPQITYPSSPHLELISLSEDPTKQLKEEK